MRVALLNDLPVAGPTSSGPGSGAELTCGRFAKEGHARGHDVDVLCPQYFSEDVLSGYDLVVTKNVTGFTRHQLAAVAKKKFVAWPSDFCWTRWRLYFAFQEWHRTLPSLAFWAEWMRLSAFNVYLSPLHQECYEWVMPALEGHASMVSPPPIDTEQFKPNKDGYEPNTACGINVGLDFKALHGCLSFCYDNPDISFTFIGAMRDNVDMPPNAVHVGRLPWTKLVETLGRTEFYVELPRTCQPANQTAFQGFLACKTVVANPLLGAASFDWFKRGHRVEGRLELRTAMAKLWTRLEKEAA